MKFLRTLKRSPRETGEVDRTNILGTSIGMKESGGTLTGDWAVRIYVKEKVSPSDVGDGLIPQVYGAYATDVVEIGEVYPESGFRNFERPARCGSSCGHLGVTAGTIGSLCTKNNRLMLLSNNHILANSNNASAGDFIVHPGPADGGLSNTNVIGALEDFVPIDFAGTNSVDAALAFTSFSLVSPDHRTYTMDPNPIMATHGMSVMKNGRTTGLTFGRIAGINASLPVNFGTRFNPIVARFSGQLEIHGVSGRFSDGGDSGSVIVEQTTQRPTALLFAGNGVSTWANPIERVISELGIDELIDRVF